jgi:hypothetical protein
MVVNPDLNVPMNIQEALCVIGDEHHHSDVEITIEYSATALIVAVARHKKFEATKNNFCRLVVERSRLDDAAYLKTNLEEFREHTAQLAKRDDVKVAAMGSGS